MQDLISVIIPVYNVELYLEKCINSVLNQTVFKLMEVILVDDGSTDKSGQICDRCSEMHNNMHVYHKENGGLSDARNFGMQKASGNLIAFIDSDDIIDERYIEKLYNNFKKYNADISIVRYKRFHNYEELFDLKDIEEEIKVYSSEKALEILLYSPEIIPQSACCKLYKKGLFENINYPVGRLNEDIAVTYKLFDRADKIVCSNLSYYFYYQRQGSIVRSEFNERTMDTVIFADEILKYVEKRRPKLRKAAICFALSQNIQVLIKLPYKEERFKEYTRIISGNIKKYRGTVACDSKATWKRRLGALSTYGGMWVSKKLGKLYKIKVNHEKIV